MMEVKINQDLSFRIGHKTKMGKADDIFAHGNLMREQKGLKAFDKITDIIRKRSFWEFVVAVDTQNDEFQSGKFPLWNSSDFSILDESKDKKGRMDLVKLLKLYPHLIKSQRGGKIENRGYWMNLHLLLKLATMLDPDLEVQIYNVFIKGKILEYRDSGGDAFKELNKAIDTLPDRIKKAKKRNIPIAKNNKRVYIEVSKQVRKLLDIYDEEVWGYNDKEHTGEILSHRAELLKFLVNGIKHKMIVSYPQLKEVIKNFEF